jgi:hypothetical protein
MLVGWLPVFDEEACKEKKNILNYQKKLFLC